jgi:hypothetical protein
MVMMRMIVMVGVIVVMGRDGRQWLKNALHPLKSDAFAGEKLEHGGIFRDMDRARQYLHAEMEIAETPCDACGLLNGCNRNCQHLFRLLLNDVMRLADRKKMIAVGQCLIEIEAELPAILRRAAPAPLGQSGAIGPQVDVDMMPRGAIVFGFLDESQVGHDH